MGLGERLKKTFSRGSNTSSKSNSTSSTASKEDPTDKTSSMWYQPGEKIPYKYRRPVEPSHKAKLESFSFSWTRRKSSTSQYSPMGSRMPSRSGPRIPRRSVDYESIGPMDNSSENHLETIQSVQTGSHAGSLAQLNDAGFTMDELQKAMQKAGSA